ncbi:hypothetical protein [Burkholderia gladioli]|uniref:hypothetical protein n=1 Tax=Burkholderia gladioli TaxID=28095 RepID=UPI0016413810|nr:hypothetical protein [Burkholderia gladioli]
MEIYEGDLLEGGVSDMDGRWKKYTFLKIGNHQLNNVRIDPKFDRILHNQIDRGVVKLWVVSWFSKNVIIGITQADGQTFRQGLGQFYLQLAIAVVSGAIVLLVGLASGTALADVAGLLLMFGASLIPMNFINKVKSVKADHVY